MKDMKEQNNSAPEFDWGELLNFVGKNFIDKMNSFQQDMFMHVFKYALSEFDSDEKIDFESEEGKKTVNFMKRIYELGFYSGVHFTLDYAGNDKEFDDSVQNILDEI